MTIISDLRNNQAGYQDFAGYPGAYQATDFPLHGDTVRITGNNQAFFFVKGVKGDAGEIADIEPNVAALRKLFDNIVSRGPDADHRPLVRLQIDADVIENPQRFVAKYQHMRSEIDQAKREELLGKEASTIRGIVDSGVLRQIAAESLQADAVRRGAELSPATLSEKVDEFFALNFRLEGVRTAEPLRFATWEIQSPEGGFFARQEYKQGTYMVERPWKVGTTPELFSLAAGNGPNKEGAALTLEAVRHTAELPVAVFSGKVLQRPAPLAAQPSTFDKK